MKSSPLLFEGTNSQKGEEDVQSVSTMTLENLKERRFQTKSRYSGKRTRSEPIESTKIFEKELRVTPPDVVGTGDEGTVIIPNLDIKEPLPKRLLINLDPTRNQTEIYIIPDVNNGHWYSDLIGYCRYLIEQSGESSVVESLIDYKGRKIDKLSLAELLDPEVMYITPVYSRKHTTDTKGKLARPFFALVRRFTDQIVSAMITPFMITAKDFNKDEEQGVQIAGKSKFKNYKKGKKDKKGSKSFTQKKEKLKEAKNKLKAKMEKLDEKRRNKKQMKQKDGKSSVSDGLSNKMKQKAKTTLRKAAQLNTLKKTKHQYVRSSKNGENYGINSKLMTNVAFDCDELNRNPTYTKVVATVPSNVFQNSVNPLEEKYKEYLQTKDKGFGKSTPFLDCAHSPADIYSLYGVPKTQISIGTKHFLNLDKYRARKLLESLKNGEKSNLALIPSKRAELVDLGPTNGMHRTPLYYHPNKERLWVSFGEQFLVKFVDTFSDFLISMPDFAERFTSITPEIKNGAVENVLEMVYNVLIYKISYEKYGNDILGFFSAFVPPRLLKRGAFVTDVLVPIVLPALVKAIIELFAFDNAFLGKVQHNEKMVKENIDKIAEKKHEIESLHKVLDNLKTSRISSTVSSTTEILLEKTLDSQTGELLELQNDLVTLTTTKRESYKVWLTKEMKVIPSLEKFQKRLQKLSKKLTRLAMKTTAGEMGLIRAALKNEVVTPAIQKIDDSKNTSPTASIGWRLPPTANEYERSERWLDMEDSDLDDYSDDSDSIVDLTDGSDWDNDEIDLGSESDNDDMIGAKHEETTLDHDNNTPMIDFEVSKGYSLNIPKALAGRRSFLFVIENCRRKIQHEKLKWQSKVDQELKFDGITTEDRAASLTIQRDQDFKKILAMSQRTVRILVQIYMKGFLGVFVYSPDLSWPGSSAWLTPEVESANKFVLLERYPAEVIKLIYQTIDWIAQYNSNYKNNTATPEDREEGDNQTFETYADHLTSFWRDLRLRAEREQRATEIETWKQQQKNVVYPLFDANSIGGKSGQPDKPVSASAEKAMSLLQSLAAKTQKK